MGGCCCCASKGSQLNSAPAYYYYPRVPEERVPLSLSHGAGSAISTGLLVDTNLDTSIPDAYRPPPAPLPFDAALGYTQGTLETCNDKNDGGAQTANSGSAQEAANVSSQGSPDKREDLKESKGKSESDFDFDSSKELEVDLPKSVLSAAEEEDGCPICLEEYDLENPKLVTNCDHHFHLACILEWMERSEVCPVCDKVVQLVDTDNYGLVNQVLGN